MDYRSTEMLEVCLSMDLLLGDKGCALRTVDKGIPRGISRGPDPLVYLLHQVIFLNSVL